MRFVHSRGDLSSLCRRDSLDGGGDCGGIIEVGPGGAPRSVLAEVPRALAAPMTPALPCMGARAWIGPVATDALQGMRLGTRGWQPSPGPAGMAFEPRLHGRGLRPTGVLHAPLETGAPWSWRGVIPPCQQVTEARLGGAGAAAMEEGAGDERQGASARGLRVRAGGHACRWAPVGPPGRADRGPQVDSEGLGPDHHRRRLPRLGMNPPTGPAVDPRGIILLGHQRRPVPDPSPLVKPAAYRPSRDVTPMLSLEFYGQRRAPPPRATPALGTRCGLA
jgi:hypothetical protein